jgi:sugar phosphate isomerase/epimerase
MRLGGFFDETFSTPDEWITVLQAKGYTAAYSPYRIPPSGKFPSEADLLAYHQAAQQAGIVIAEVGAWGRNYVTEDERERNLAIEESITLLRMADTLHARCLVNSSGWRRNPAENFSYAIFEQIVATVQTILDAVNPTHTSFTLELTPTIFPHTCDSYLDLLKAVNRAAFGVHFDPVNVMATPYLCYHNAELIEEYVAKLGPHIKSCHAKDAEVMKGMVVHINETRPGLGCLDYPVLIRALNRLDPDMPLMMEHLENNSEYQLAAEYIRACVEAVS